MDPTPRLAPSLGGAFPALLSRLSRHPESAGYVRPRCRPRRLPDAGYRFHDSRVNLCPQCEQGRQVRLIGHGYSTPIGANHPSDHQPKIFVVTLSFSHQRPLSSGRVCPAFCCQVKLDSKVCQGYLDTCQIDTERGSKDMKQDFWDRHAAAVMVITGLLVLGCGTASEWVVR